MDGKREKCTFCWVSNEPYSLFWFPPPFTHHTPTHPHTTHPHTHTPHTHTPHTHTPHPHTTHHTPTHHTPTHTPPTPTQSVSLPLLISVYYFACDHEGVSVSKNPMSYFRMYVPAKLMYVEDYTTKLTTYNICSHSLSPACIPLVVYTCSCTCRGKNGLPKFSFPQNLFYRRIWTPSRQFGPVAYPGVFPRFLRPIAHNLL